MKGSRNIFVICLLAIILWLPACKEYKVSDDPSLQLSFSCDTLRFDTVFTEQGSATAQVMVDGEADLTRLTRLQINGGDSLFVFIRVDIDPTNSDAPVLVTDRLNFHLANGNTQGMEMEAYGQDVIRIGTKGCGRTEMAYMTFKNARPYLVYDTLVVGGLLSFQAGSTVYMHQGACIVALGDVRPARPALRERALPLCRRRLERHLPASGATADLAVRLCGYTLR